MLRWHRAWYLHQTEGVIPLDVLFLRSLPLISRSNGFQGSWPSPGQHPGKPSEPAASLVAAANRGKARLRGIPGKTHRSSKTPRREKLKEWSLWQRLTALEAIGTDVVLSSGRQGRKSHIRRKCPSSSPTWYCCALFAAAAKHGANSNGFIAAEHYVGHHYTQIVVCLQKR